MTILPVYGGPIAPKIIKEKPSLRLLCRRRAAQRAQTIIWQAFDRCEIPMRDPFCPLETSDMVVHVAEREIGDSPIERGHVAR